MKNHAIIPRPEEIIRVGEQFYVLAASSRADDRTRVLKHGETFGVFDRHGDILPIGLGEEGLYHEGTRFLSRFELILEDARPLLLTSSVDEDNMVLAVDLTNQDLTDESGIVAPRGIVHIFRTRLLLETTLYERIVAHNFSSQNFHLRMSLHFDADFADMFEVRGVQRERRGRRLENLFDDRQAVLTYLGLDGVRRTTRLICDPPPTQVSSDHFEFESVLEPRQELELEMQIVCRTDHDSSTPPIESPQRTIDTYEKAFDQVQARSRKLRESECEVYTSNEQCNEWISRSLADLRMMMAQTPQGIYPHAGVPWFSTPFGRDGIITALQTLWVTPDTARGVLGFLAANQAEKLNPGADAQPGKILHEMRGGEMAATGEIPYARYYGSVDSTPLFIILAGEYYRATADHEFIRGIWPNIERALAWIDTYGDADGDGFVEYQCRAAHGLANQGWKDSGDSISHHDGTLAEPPIALCEVQGYVYAARRAASRLANALGQQSLAVELADQAERLRSRFAESFWDDELGLFVLALDGHKKPCRVASSNAGQCLFTAIPSGEHAARCIQTLMRSEIFSGWGVRTLAITEPRYNPMSYHNGSIWPHDNSLIAWGMARYGQPAVAAQIFDAMLDASNLVESHRLPELFCGFHRRQGEGPITYPLACAPQAWAAGAVFLLLQASLGMQLRADLGELRLHAPILPESLKFVQIRNLRVAGQTLDLSLHHQPDDVAVTVPRRAHGVRVIVTR